MKNYDNNYSKLAKAADNDVNIEKCLSPGGMITLKVNNDDLLTVIQNADDETVHVRRLRDEEYSKLDIPAGDMVMLLNYYRYVKEEDIHCDFVNPRGQSDPYSSSKPTNKKKDYKTYSELALAADNEKDFEKILHYENSFSVVRDNETGQYWYLEEPENDAGEFFELRLVSSLSPSNDLLVDGAFLADMFESVCCGEYIDSDGKCTYMWFDLAEEILERSFYDVPIQGGSITGNLVNIIGEQKVKRGGFVLDMYLYDIVGYTPKNGKPFAARKSNIYIL